MTRLAYDDEGLLDDGLGKPLYTVCANPVCRRAICVDCLEAMATEDSGRSILGAARSQRRRARFHDSRVARRRWAMPGL